MTDVFASHIDAVVHLIGRLDPSIRRLATNHDGERLAVMAALDRVLAAGGSTFNDLADWFVAGAQPRAGAAA